MRPHAAASSGNEEAAPNNALAAAVAASPPASRTVGWVRAPRTPEANLETPYMTGRMEVKVPTSDRVKPSALSSSMNGAVKASELRVR